jgi:hypothetical protein
MTEIITTYRITGDNRIYQQLSGSSSEIATTLQIEETAVTSQNGTPEQLGKFHMSELRVFRPGGLLPICPSSGSDTE